MLHRIDFIDASLNLPFLPRSTTFSDVTGISLEITPRDPLSEFLRAFYAEIDQEFSLVASLSSSVTAPETLPSFQAFTEAQLSSKGSLLLVSTLENFESSSSHSRTESSRRAFLFDSRRSSCWSNIPVYYFHRHRNRFKHDFCLAQCYR